MTRRNAKERPARSTRFSMLSVVEALEPRAMLAGVGLESWSTAGPTFVPLGTGPASSSSALLTCSSPTPGSSGSSSSLAPTLGNGGSQSTGLALPSNSGLGAGSSSTGSGSSNSGGLALPSNSGSGAGSFPTGSGSTNSVGLALPSNSGSGTGSSNSGTGSNSDPNSSVLSAQYNEGSNAGGQGAPTNTSSGGDLWLLYGAGSATGSSSSGATGGSTGTSQSPGGVGTLTGFDLWSLYGTDIWARSSSGTAKGSLTNEPTLSAKYNGGSGGGQWSTAATLIPGGLVYFVIGSAEANASGSGNAQGSSGSTTLALADSQSAPTMTPLVYQPGIDGGPVFVSGVWMGDGGGVQFVQVGEIEGRVPGSPYSTPIMIGQGLWPFPRVFEVPPVTAASLPVRPRDALAWTDAAGNRWNTDIGEISAYGPPPPAPTLSEVFEACGSVMVAILARRAAQNGRSLPIVGVPTNLGPIGQKASRFVSPGIRVLEGQYIDDLGRAQPWRAFYDEYGRMIGRTDYNAGSRGAGIPDTHYERWEYNSQFPLGRKVENHRPGEFPQ